MNGFEPLVDTQSPWCLCVPFFPFCHLYKCNPTGSRYPMPLKASFSTLVVIERESRTLSMLFGAFCQFPFINTSLLAPMDVRSSRFGGLLKGYLLLTTKSNSVENPPTISGWLVAKEVPAFSAPPVLSRSA